MQKDPEMLDKYNQIIKEQQDAGIMEEVPKYNIPTAGKTYYMPHQLVVRQDRVTIKLRIVYDASSKLHGNRWMTASKIYRPNTEICFQCYFNHSGKKQKVFRKVFHSLSVSYHYTLI